MTLIKPEDFVLTKIPGKPEERLVVLEVDALNSIKVHTAEQGVRWLSEDWYELA